MPKLKIPSAVTIKNSTHPRFEYYKEKVKKFFHTTSSTVTLCVDGWSSKTTSHYLGINGHVLFDKKIRQIVLGFIKCDETDGKSIYMVVKKCVKEYTLGHRIIAICTDNGNITLILASPNKVFVEKFQSWAEKHRFPFRTEYGWIRCFNQCINLEVEGKVQHYLDLLKNFNDLMEKLHSLIKQIKYSYYLSKELEKLCSNYPK